MRVISVNGKPLTDMIGLALESDEETVALEVFDPSDGSLTPVELERFPGEDWGLQFDGPIFDEMRTCVNACVFCFMTMLPKGGRDTLLHSRRRLPSELSPGQFCHAHQYER